MNNSLDPFPAIDRIFGSPCFHCYMVGDAFMHLLKDNLWIKTHVKKEA